MMAYVENPPVLWTAVGQRYLQLLSFSVGVAAFNTSSEVAPTGILARLNVIAEMIIAMVLIGLFLNSLAYDFGTRLISAQKINKKTNRVITTADKKRQTKGAADRKSGRRPAMAQPRK